MARHGRLSKGCQTCRKRKIKCDQELPTCGQCKKSGWACPRYADVVERMFQHHCKSHDNKQSKKGNSSTDLVLVENPKASPFSVSQMVDNLAMQFFFAEHVFRESGVARGHFEFLPVYTSDSDANKTLSASLKAATLAAYAHKFRYPILVRKSRIYYDLALKSLQVDLLSPAVATKSSTIVTMMLLGTFETLNCENINMLSSTDAHMSGAMKCISLQVGQILKSHHGIQLFLQTSWCRLVTCILRSSPVPEEFIQTRRHAAKFLATDDPAWKLSEIMEKVAKFRAEVKLGTVCKTIDIVGVALGLDQELSVLAENMPFEWRFQRIPAEQDPGRVFDSYYHVYSDLWISCIWNFIRTSRLVLLKEIRRQHCPAPDVVIPVFSTFNCESNYGQLHVIMESLASEICATIPQFCDDLKGRYIEVATTKTDVPTTASVYHLFWPLLNAAQTTSLDNRRDWIINRCRDIGHTTGIQQCFALADFLETQEDIDSWVERQDEEHLSSLNISG
ncbi:C6 transcription factor, putative [Talaromyces stipitatus ATCC 10500]|uniref:C6 transcription factor, putative n=1 Tax=Talaromyces stipitatus (strain ATCC 10500 / CBS 375.48 / QM 6759 / NRRL 1006) TaxID=441959 RepID=B8LZL9_TALSN|nr:C6 transcription factor, putative [Talaromyces stipitatus ATCC 10500]EED22442.1 C6 transcription factor, putative [Talaromyces stipitatus ATCC 10500]